MNNILKDFIDKGWRTHQLQTKEILERLRKHDLYLKPEKCEFDVVKTLFLGLVITPGHVQMDPTKLAGIKDWELPTTLKGRHAEIARPLHDLTKKDVPFEWTKQCQVAFEIMKAKFLQQPILKTADDTQPFVIEADASKWATGAVLQQKDTDNELHPCGYLLHALMETERNYEIYDRELLAIVNALKAWEHYLLGSTHPVTILSDHKNLSYFRTAQKLNRRQARWSLYLSQFELQLIHIPGTRMVQSDALSRRPDLVEEKDTDNEDVVVLPDKLFINTINTELKDMLEEALPTDKFFKMTIESLLEKGVTPIKSSLQDWRTTDGILYYKNRAYVPNDPTLHKHLVKSIHEALPHGHPGQWNTIDQIQRDYWWPGMTKYIKTFVDRCAA
ncbi:pro-pol protein, partial [Moniliophthora roreri MCA 2997]